MALAVALRGRARLASLTVIEAPAVMMLDGSGELQHIRAFGEMTARYFAAFRDGKADAIEALIDFFAGAGTFASWPPRVRAYAMATTPVNILDWETAFDYPLTAEVLAQVQIPTLVIRGGESHPAMQRVNEILERTDDPGDACNHRRRCAFHDRDPRGRSCSIACPARPLRRSRVWRLKSGPDSAGRRPGLLRG